MNIRTEHGDSKNRFEDVELPAKLLDYLLPSNSATQKHTHIHTHTHTHTYTHTHTHTSYWTISYQVILQHQSTLQYYLVREATGLSLTK